MNQNERRLLRLYRGLSATQKASLLDYAAYLSQQAALKPQEKEPLPIPRPAKESVIAAIRRLKQTYPMLDGSRLLHETASLMAQHVVHKRLAAEVIDELEALFRRLYEEYRKD